MMELNIENMRLADINPADGAFFRAEYWGR
jgi:hypothetical protein